jgi:cold shock CspA family protein
MRPRAWVAGGMGLLAVAVVAAVAYISADTGESAGREEGVTLRDVVSDPERFEGQRVQISGEWAENDYFAPAQAEEVIVLGDDAATPLLVVPELGVDVPVMDENSVVVVEGIVRVPDRAQAGLLGPAALMEGDDGGVAPVVAASRVKLTEGPEPPIAAEADEATIRQLLRDPRAWGEASLVVPGQVTRITGRGFTLTDEGTSIFVSAPAAELSELKQGQRVRIRAELSRLSQFGADAVEQAVTTVPPGDQAPPVTGLGDIPIERGEPYLLLRGIEPRT